MSAALIAALSEIVGAVDAFAFSDDRAAPHRARFGAIGGLRGGIAAIARPADVAALQASIRAIRRAEHRLLSTPNLSGNGAALEPGDSPVVVLDLSRMNRIVELNGPEAYALVEPGVTYRQLHERVVKESPHLWIDCDRDPDASVVGSIRARDYGYTPYGDHLGMQCGMEVVLGDGSLARTGMGALPGSNTWQMFKYNFGPYLDGIFTQSDFAIPVKMGVWLMPAVPGYKPFMATLADRVSLSLAVEALRPLRIGNVIANPARIVHASLDAAPFTPQPDDLAALAASRGGEWRLYGALYDLPQNIDILWGAVAAALGSVAGATVSLGDPNDPAWAEREALMRGVPPSAPPHFAGWGGEAVMTLTVASALEGAHALAMHDVAKEALDQRGQPYLSEYILASRTLLYRLYLPYRPDRADNLVKVLSAGEAVIEALGKAGFALADESIELRLIAAKQSRGSGHDLLTARIRSALSG